MFCAILAGESSWEKIAERLPERTESAVRHRWYDHLQHEYPELVRIAAHLWTPEEDEVIVAALTAGDDHGSNSGAADIHTPWPHCCVLLQLATLECSVPFWQEGAPGKRSLSACPSKQNRKSKTVGITI
jgi:hypothetical protein